jgi:hypothetical protein
MIERLTRTGEGLEVAFSAPSLARDICGPRRVRTSQRVGRRRELHNRDCAAGRTVKGIPLPDVPSPGHAVLPFGPNDSRCALRECAVVIEEREVLVRLFLTQIRQERDDRSVEQVVAAIGAARVLGVVGRQAAIGMIVSLGGCGDQVKVVGASRPVGGLPKLLHQGQEKGDRHGDDGDQDKQLDQREGPSRRGHGSHCNAPMMSGCPIPAHSIRGRFRNHFPCLQRMSVMRAKAVPYCW